MISDFEHFIDLNGKLYKYVGPSVRADVKRYIDVGVQVESDLYADNFKDIGIELKTERRNTSKHTNMFSGFHERQSRS